MPGPYGPNNPPPMDYRRTGGTEPGILGQAFDIQDEENRRYREGVGILTGAHNRLSGVLNEPLDADLLFSKSADSIGSRVRGQMDSLRTSLGARGISPNSGAASGMLSRLAFGQQQALAGARLDSEIEAKKMRQVSAAQDFAASGVLADFVNSAVPQAGLDASMAVAEMNTAVRGQQNAIKAQERANRANILSSLLGGGLGILGRMAA